MKKLPLKISTGISAFFLGTVSAILGSGLFLSLPEIPAPFEAQMFPSAPVPVTVCQLDDSPDSFDGKRITTEATIYFTGFDNSIVLYPKDCDRKMFEYHISYLKPATASELNPNLLRELKSEKPYSKEIDVRVIGVVRKFNDELSGKSYMLTPEKIESISPFREFRPKGAA